MKILRLGKLATEIEYHTTCFSCGTEFSFLGGEADLDWDAAVLRIQCPLTGCGHMCKVNKKVYQGN